jgi:Fe-S-cluster containining protein
MRTHLSSDETFGLFHACSTCGGSCQGVIISLMDDEEVERIERLGGELGVRDAVVDGRLQLIDGHCVFLGEDNLCRIHKRFGLEAKPTVCRQFPMVAIRAEEGLRIGVDPACYSAFSSMEDGPPVASGALVATASRLDERQLEFERKFLQLCEVDGMTVATLAAWLSGEQPSPQGLLPAGFEERLVERVRDAGLVEWVEQNPVGRAIRTNLLPVLQFAEQHPQSRWGELDSDADCWAVEAIRRVLFLRLTGDVPTVAGSALLLVSGAILCGRANPASSEFSRAFAGWVRAIRFRQFWTRFAPDSATMADLLRP